jgi:hypothetical protein
MRVERRRDLRSCTSNWRREPMSPDEKFEVLLKRLMVANATERAARVEAPHAAAVPPMHRVTTRTPEPVAIGGAPRRRLPTC